MTYQVGLLALAALPPRAHCSRVRVMPAPTGGEEASEADPVVTTSGAGHLTVWTHPPPPVAEVRRARGR